MLTLLQSSSFVSLTPILCIHLPRQKIKPGWTSSKMQMMFPVRWDKQFLKQLTLTSTDFKILGGVHLPWCHPHLPGSQAGADMCVLLRATGMLRRASLVTARSSDKRVYSLRTPGPSSPIWGEGRTHNPCPTQLHQTASAYFSCHRKNVVLPQLINLLGFQNINGTDRNHNCILKLAQSGGTVHYNNEFH